MTSNAPISDDVREELLTKPEAILEDQDMMRALIAANERAMGANIVDLRGIAMERLEARLDRLEDTHRSVIAAAYENLAGMNLIHRATLRILEQEDFEAFLRELGTDIADILRVDCLRLVLETVQEEENEAIRKMGDVLVTAPVGFSDTYVGRPRDVGGPAVVLRQVQEQDKRLFGDSGYWIRSEAIIRLDLGEGRLPAMLVMGAEDPHQFKPGQGTDLLSYFGGVFERTMRRWLG
ncbi:DUF484 family protein [Maritimibacter sp. UBA3975]|uniref:DUF484 family protein n=1 Tax=Maritimibacter sp. UBA3975 TaxID=1946833 RepID=UPI000C0A1D9E|nr:DUF484 family protein [Maritimibacter sp. UBA3975]MAM63088.1 recombinase XerC [Maritimibacter sp.]|tara:strand:- start:21299 stop:22006 length:708 start_codon:yes stop_codon:yes gene_type:complete